MRIAVTGGAGYIGSIVARLLVHQGHEVHIVDSLVRGHRKAVGDLPFTQCDVRHRENLESIFRENRIEAVIHFAAYALVGESVERPEIYYENNLGGALAVASAMVGSGVPYVVFSSTAAVYGQPKSSPIEESAPTVPTNPYGESKRLAETMWRAFCATGKISWVALRYFNAAGAAPQWGLGEDHQPETHLIPLLLDSFDPNKPVLKLFGDDYPTPDGTCIRDYVHVLDLAEAHASALAYLAAQPTLGVAEAINLGTGNGMSVLEMIVAAETVVGQKARTEIAPRRPGDPARLVASNRLAREILNWIPQHSTPSKILEDAWAWRQTHPYGYGN